MASFGFLVFLVSVIAEAGSSTITRYQHFPLPLCPEDAVCSELYALPEGFGGDSLPMYNWKVCRCPTGQYCPSEPGTQTLSVNQDRWYGICEPVSELKRCMKGEIAEEVVVGAEEFGGRTYTKIHCTCPRHELAELEEGAYATAWSNTRQTDPNAKAVYELVCMEDISKRGGERYGGSRGSSRRFYFY